MQPILISNTDRADRSTDERLLVHAWRSEQLRRLGLSRTLAETFAELVDWHEIAFLVSQGCSPELAIEIVR